MKTFMKLLLVAVLSWPVLACGDLYTGVFKNMGIILLAPPALNDLGPLADSGSILVPRPTLATDGHLDTTIAVYCGIDGEISVTGHEVSGIYTQGSLDTAAGGFVFAGLDMNKTYRIIVVARNAMGYSVKQVAQNTYYPIAVAVYGQGATGDNFTTGGSGVSSTGLSSPRGIAVNASGIFVADTNSHRAVYYSFYDVPSDASADRVYGQGGSFTGQIQNYPTGSITDQGFWSPFGIAVDANGVYIADSSNNRVLYYLGDSTTPTRVYGQGPSGTNFTSSGSATSATGLYGPTGIAVDASGVYIADTVNNRVLYYGGTSVTATRVYGQGGSFTTRFENNGGVSASSLYYPYGLAVASGGIYIADYLNNRVLYYEGTSTTATRVYGQGGSFVTNDDNMGGSVSAATTLYNPTGVAVDERGVYIADYNNNRVLHYWGTSVTATGVYGQGGNLDTRTQNYPSGSVTAISLNGPWGMAVYNERLYIVDRLNNRVLRY